MNVIKNSIIRDYIIIEIFFYNTSNNHHCFSRKIPNIFNIGYTKTKSSRWKNNTAYSRHYKYNQYLSIRHE